MTEIYNRGQKGDAANAAAENTFMQQVAGSERGGKKKTSATYLIATRGLCCWPWPVVLASLTACLGRHSWVSCSFLFFFWNFAEHAAYTLYSCIERSKKLLHTFRRRLKITQNSTVYGLSVYMR